MNSIKNEIQILGSYLVQLTTNPIRKIGDLPEVGGFVVFLFQILCCLFSVFFVGILLSKTSSLYIMSQLVGTFSLIFVLTLSFKAWFGIAYKKNIHFQKLWLLVTLSHIPFIFFNTFFFTQIVGFGIAYIALTIGLSENFRVPKKTSLICVLGICSCCYIFWFLVGPLAFNPEEKEPSKKTLDSMEKELGKL